MTEYIYYYEEILYLGTFANRTRGIDIFNKFQYKCREVGLNLVNLVRCRLSGPSKTRKHEVHFFAQVKIAIADPEVLISLHCRPPTYARHSTKVGQWP